MLSASVFCRWRAFYYNSVLVYGICVLWDKPWLWDIRSVVYKLYSECQLYSVFESFEDKAA